jgi:hypothetical protein
VQRKRKLHQPLQTTLPQALYASTKICLAKWLPLVTGALAGADVSGDANAFVDIADCIDILAKSSDSQLIPLVFQPMISWARMLDVVRKLAGTEEPGTSLANSEQGLKIMTIFEGLPNFMETLTTFKLCNQEGMEELNRISGIVVEKFAPKLNKHLSDSLKGPMDNANKLISLGNELIDLFTGSATAEDIVSKAQTLVKAFSGFDDLAGTLEKGAVGELGCHRCQYLVRLCKCYRSMSDIVQITLNTDHGSQVFRASCFGLA